MNFNQIYKKIESFYSDKFTEYSKKELLELESLFNTVSLGFLFGIPIVPEYIALQLLKDIEQESFQLTINKATLSSHPLSYLFSTFDIG